jgi:hypothetical protein
MNSHPNQGFWLFPASHANGGDKVLRDSHFMNWPSTTPPPLRALVLGGILL